MIITSFIQASYPQNYQYERIKQTNPRRFIDSQGMDETEIERS